MGDEIPQDDNNVRSGQTSTEYDKEYINQSLREYALILHEYLNVMERNVKN